MPKSISERKLIAELASRQPDGILLNFFIQVEHSGRVLVDSGKLFMSRISARIRSQAI